MTTQPERKLYAVFSAAPRTAEHAIEIKTAQDAADYAVKTGKDDASFAVFEATPVTVKGFERLGVILDKQETIGGKNWLSVDEVVPVARIIALYEEKIRQEDPVLKKAADTIFENQDLYESVHESFAAQGRPAQELWEAAGNRQRLINLKIYPSATPYFRWTRGKHATKSYFNIGPDDRVYNRQGRQIWPKPSARPAAKSAPRP